MCIWNCIRIKDRVRHLHDQDCPIFQHFYCSKVANVLLLQLLFICFWWSVISFYLSIILHLGILEKWHTVTISFPPGWSQPDYGVYLTLGKMRYAMMLCFPPRLQPIRPWSLPSPGKNEPCYDVMFFSGMQPTRPWSLLCPGKNKPCYDVMFSSRLQPTRLCSQPWPGKNEPCCYIFLQAAANQTNGMVSTLPCKNEPCYNVIFSAGCNQPDHGLYFALENTKCSKML